MPIDQLPTQGYPQEQLIKALIASMATLSQHIKAVTVHMGEKPSKDNDAMLASDRKMSSNAENTALTKDPKKEQE